MKKSVALLFFLVLMASCLIVAKPAFSSVAVAEDTWAAKAPMQQARAGLGVAVVNGKIYAIGGTHATGQYPPDVISGGFLGTNEEYDPETDTWTTKAPMPTPRDYFAIAAYQNKIYCIGGAVNYTADEEGLFRSIATYGGNEVYDTVTDTWETKTPMPDDGKNIQAHVINGKIYVMDWSHVYVYDPENDSWTNKTRMPQPYPDYDSSPVSAIVDNRIIVTFESDSSVQKVMIYDTETDSWSEGASGPSVGGVGSVAAATVGVNALQRVYLLRWGINQVYDPEADAWTTAAAMPTSRIDFGVAVVDDVLYAIGGYYKPSRYGVQPAKVNEQYIPFGYGGVPPKIKVLSPINQLYNESSVSLNFTVNKPTNWTGYSLDGQETVTTTGNTTITGLSNGLHNITVYARDEFENTGVSETASFSVDVPFPTTIAVAASAVLVAVICVGLLVYFKKRKR
jgi:hypothetical protein